MKRSIPVIIKVYTLWLLQVIFYYTQYRFYFMRLYIKSFKRDWMGKNE
jgi:hypothetical protein